MDEKKIIVNGNQVTQEQLDELKKDKKIRLHEEAPDSYRVLNKLEE